MRKRILLAAMLILGTVFLRGDGCIMKEKVFEIVIFAETSAEFVQVSQSESFQNAVTVGFDDNIDAALEDAGYSRDDIISAEVQGARYGALANNTSHDWTITGAITVERTDTGGSGAVTAVNYTSQSVNAALGRKIPAPLQSAAVDLINAALVSYLDGASGIELEFVIENGSVDPSPEAGDPINFTWKAWVTITVVLPDEADWPDPF